MHYKNGREAKVGDEVIVFNGDRPNLLGLLVSATPGSTSCNGRVLPMPVNNAAYVTIGDCLHVEDVAQKVPAPTP